MLLKVAELYDTSYDFEAAEWIWGQYKQTTNYEEFRDKYPQGVRDLNYLKGLHQNLS